MFKSGLLAAVAACAMVLGAAGAGHANVVTWTISDGVFSDGGTLSGTFSIDTSNDEITAYDLVTTPGAAGSFPSLPFPGPTQFGNEYSLTSPGMWFDTVNGGAPSFVQLQYLDPSDQYLFTSELDLTAFPPSGVGTYNLAGGTEEMFFDAEIPTGISRTLLSGMAVAVGAVPEPATWAMLILGVGMVGAVARRRGRGVALAA